MLEGARFQASWARNFRLNLKLRGLMIKRVRKIEEVDVCVAWLAILSYADRGSTSVA